MSAKVGWECINGDLGHPSKCTPKCGDGLLWGKETCDDGKKDQIGCKSSCTGPLDGFNCT